VSDTPRTDAAYAASIGAGIYELFKESQDIERELKAAEDHVKQLEIIISRASTAFFCDGSDGQVASRMLAILEEGRSKP